MASELEYILEMYFVNNGNSQKNNSDNEYTNLDGSNYFKE